VDQALEAIQADQIRALSRPDRLLVVAALGEAALDIDTLTTATGLPPTVVACHVRALAEAGLVEVDRARGDRRYRLADPEIGGACAILRQVVIRRVARLRALVPLEHGRHAPASASSRQFPTSQVNQA
jgi:DNA-binding transcriptional ArsR family regulator